MSTYLGILSQPPATWRYWSTRLRARRVGRLREMAEVESWLSMLRGAQ